MSPLGFDVQQMFRFLAVRFRGTHLRVQQQTLNWLQLLSSLHITVNIDLLVNIFQEGVTTSKLDEDLPGMIFYFFSKTNEKNSIIRENRFRYGRNQSTFPCF